MHRFFKLIGPLDILVINQFLFQVIFILNSEFYLLSIFGLEHDPIPDFFSYLSIRLSLKLIELPLLSLLRLELIYSFLPHLLYLVIVDGILDGFHLRAEHLSPDLLVLELLNVPPLSIDLFIFYFLLIRQWLVKLSQSPLFKFIEKTYDFKDF